MQHILQNTIAENFKITEIPENIYKQISEFLINFAFGAVQQFVDLENW